MSLSATGQRHLLWLGIGSAGRGASEGGAGGCGRPGEAAPPRREGLRPVRAPPRGALPPLRRRVARRLIHCLDKSILSGPLRRFLLPLALLHWEGSAAGKPGRGPGLAVPGHLWGGGAWHSRCGRTDCQRRLGTEPCARDAPGVRVRAGGSICGPRAPRRGEGEGPRRPRWTGWGGVGSRHVRGPDSPQNGSLWWGWGQGGVNRAAVLSLETGRG